MNFAFLIDNLGSGGAERQCVQLALSAKLRNHKTTIIGYAAGDHFLKDVRNNGIDYQLINEDNPVNRLLKFRKKLKSIKPDVIIAFLRTPSFLAELSSLPKKTFKLIVSERNNIYNSFSISSYLFLQFHRIADFVTTNSKSTESAVVQRAPYLKGKIRTIYNGVDLQRFKPIQDYQPNKRKVLAVISSHQQHKNAGNLILALKKLKDLDKSIAPVILWYGSDTSEYTGQPSEAYRKAVEMISEFKLQDDFVLRAPVVNVETIYNQADALILPSFREGLPNSVCEGMACGLPILMSSVSDYTTLTEGNGTVFDPFSVDSIASAISWFCNLETDEILNLRSNSRTKAELLFPLEKMADSYLNLTI